MGDLDAVQVALDLWDTTACCHRLMETKIMIPLLMERQGIYTDYDIGYTQYYIYYT